MRSLKRILGLLVCMVLVLGLIAPAMAAPSKAVSPEETNKAIALRLATEGWGSKPQWEKVWDELVSPNLVQHFNSFPEPIVGLENNKRFTEGLFQGMPDANSTVEDIVADGDLVVYRSTVRGTHTGNFLGFPPTGKTSKLNDFTQLKIVNGKVVEMWYETNLLAGLEQLGIVPSAR